MAPAWGHPKAVAIPRPVLCRDCGPGSPHAPLTRTEHSSVGRRSQPHPSPAPATSRRTQALGADHHPLADGARMVVPVALLQRQATVRVPELLPIRYGRMAVSAFTYFRGGGAAHGQRPRRHPRTGLVAQSCCGDATWLRSVRLPGAALVFDINDFDAGCGSGT